MSYAKSARLLSSALGLTVNRSILVRADLRVGEKLRPTYQQLILRPRGSEVVHADETGWKVAGDKAWLWVFTNQAVTIYTIDSTRAHEVAERVLGEAFDGVLGCDCFPAYDPLAYRQQKCLGHLLKRCSRMALLENEAAVAFSQEVARLLRRAIKLKERKTEMSPRGYGVARGKLEAALDRLLTHEGSDPEAAKVVKLLTKQRAHLLTFLYVDEVDATNNLAERRIRPAVIVRKISAGNRSHPGSDTHAILTSIIQTCRQQTRTFWMWPLLRHSQPRVLNLVTGYCQDGAAQPAVSDTDLDWSPAGSSITFSSDGDIYGYGPAQPWAISWLTLIPRTCMTR